jgi:hypothetical protein
MTRVGLAMEVSGTPMEFPSLATRIPSLATKIPLPAAKILLPAARFSGGVAGIPCQKASNAVTNGTKYLPALAIP